jgi:CRISPR-associated protein Csb1
MSEANQPTHVEKPEVAQVTQVQIESWATDLSGPVALHLKQKLLPVETIEGEGGIIYPPTYADIGYNIDMLSDGTRVALIDSVGSQANRLEPIFKKKFKTDSFDDFLVPQVEIVLQPDGTNKKGKKSKDDLTEEPHQEVRSLLDLAHRSADAVVHASPTLAAEIEKAFSTLKRTGDAGPLCALAPTSLLFGVWDSRGGSNEKRPRLVRSVIRAWDVDVLHTAAQFNSVWKALDDAQKDELTAESAKKGRVGLADVGFKDAPATFRKTDKIPRFRDGSPNPEARILGGILVRGRIEREVTINLVALRGIRGQDDAETIALRRYLLGLSLLSATTDIDLFLREGCNLRYAEEDSWFEIPRRGKPTPVALKADEPLVLDLAVNRRNHFKSKWPKELKLQHEFSLAEAKKLLSKKNDDATEGGDQPS